MTREFFNRQFLILVKAFLYAEKNIDLESQDIYWDMLKAIPEDKFAQGVRHCLATYKFFPTIAELGQASLPTIKQIIRAPYNPYNYTEPITVKIDWQQQLRQAEYLVWPEVKKLSQHGHVK